MKKKILLIPLALLLAISLVGAGCPAPAPPVKDKIVIGAARPISGPLAQIGDFAFGPIYKMWVEEVNARGGIYVEEYGKNLEIELIEYDDTSDLGLMTRHLEKLMVEDKVDFVLSPCSTAFLYAAAPIFNKYGYILLGAEGGCTTITGMLPELPYFFSTLNYSDHNQIPVLADLFVEWGVESVGIIYIADLHGVEYSHIGHQEMMRVGIPVVMSKSVPPFETELTLLLKEAKSLEVDALCAFVYPPTTMSVVGQAMEIGFNPKAIVLGPGGNFAFFKDIFGAEVLEGVSGFGAWNAGTSPAAAEFTDKFIARWGEGAVDWWGGLIYYGALQFFEQAIVEAGTLDQAVIRDIMATSTFDTVLGPTRFETVGGGGGLLEVECYPGQVGQWQSGIFEVIDPGEKRTAEPIYPKPPWPTP